MALEKDYYKDTTKVTFDLGQVQLNFFEIVEISHVLKVLSIVVFESNIFNFVL